MQEVIVACLTVFCSAIVGRPLKRTGKNEIEIKPSDGNRSVYHFENGELKNMEFHISIATVYMKRIS